MPARKKSAPKPQPQQPRPELSVPTRRGRTVLTLLFCLIVLVAISQAVSTIFLDLDTNGVGTTILFALLYLAGCVYLLGIGWSAVRLLSDGRPALEANDEGLILRHLPFLGTFSISWSEVASVHVTRTLLLTHLCIVPTDARQVLRHRSLLLFALNASARLGMRTNTPLSISQNALSLPAKAVLEQMIESYRIKETE